MQVKALTEQAGISRDTLRYYEKLGLISQPLRKDNGYREYPASILRELKFIKLAQSVGFTLAEIKPAMPFVVKPQPDCPVLTNAINKQLLQIEEKIAELAVAKNKLLEWKRKYVQKM